MDDDREPRERRRVEESSSEGVRNERVGSSATRSVRVGGGFLAETKRETKREDDVSASDVVKNGQKIKPPEIMCKEILIREDSAYEYRGRRREERIKDGEERESVEKSGSGPLTPPMQEEKRAKMSSYAAMHSQLWARRGIVNAPRRLDVKLQMQLGVIETPSSYI